MNNTVILQKKPGFIIPKLMLEEALKNCPTVVGMALQDTDENGAEILEVSRVPASVSLDKLMEINEKAKDLPLVLTLTNGSSQDFDAGTDTMPWTLQAAIRDDLPKEDILACAFEGDFSGYSKPGSKHSDEYHFWNDFVMPSLMEKLEDSKNLGDFFDKLKKTTFQQSILNAMKHRGVALFMPIVGETIVYGRNELGGEFEWGATSQLFKYKEGAGTVEKVVQAAKGRLAGILGTSEKKATAEPVKEPELKAEPVVVDKPKVEVPKTDTAVGTVKNAGKVQVKVPSKLQGNARNKWIRLFNNGKLPDGHNSRDLMIWVPAEKVYLAERDVTTSTDVHNLGLEYEGKKPLEKSNVVDMKTAHEQINTEKANDKPAADPDKPPASDFLPTISDDVKKRGEDILLEIATRPADKSPSALDIQKSEAKFGKLSEIMKFQFSDYMRWQVSDIKAMARNEPELIAMAFIEMRSKVRDGTATVKDLVQPSKPAEKPITPATEPAKQSVKSSRMDAILGRKAG